MHTFSFNSNTGTPTPESVDDASMPAPIEISILAGKRAVVAEDQGVTQLQLCRILKSAGVEVVGVAANGKEAVNQALKWKPDFILMDVEMPIMDGIDAAERILSEIPVCIVLLTAYLDADHLQDAKMCGISGYISKPVSAMSLVPRLTEALHLYYDRG